MGLVVIIISRLIVHATTVSIAIHQPQFGFVNIPSQTNRYYATVTNGTTNGITWAVNGATIVGGPFRSGWIAM